MRALILTIWMVAYHTKNPGYAVYYKNGLDDIQSQAKWDEIREGQVRRERAVLRAQYETAAWHCAPQKRHSNWWRQEHSTNFYAYPWGKISQVESQQIYDANVGTVAFL